MEKHRRSILAACMALTIGTTWAFAQTSGSSPNDALRNADQQWLEVFAAESLPKSVAFCADDGSMLAPNAPAATGKEAISHLLSGLFALPGLKVDWKPTKVDVAASGDLGYTSGSYRMSFNDPSGKPVTDVGKYVTVWKKGSGGTWKVVLDIFNTDLPARDAAH